MSQHSPTPSISPQEPNLYIQRLKTFAAIDWGKNISSFSSLCSQENYWKELDEELCDIYVKYPQLNPFTIETVKLDCSRVWTRKFPKREE